MLRIRILFVLKKGFQPLAWLICLFERSNFSHVAISFELFEREVIFHANNFRVNIEAPEIFYKHYEVKSIAVRKIMVEDMMTYLFSHVGKSYGYLTLIGIALSRIFKIKNPWRDKSKSFICSELAMHFLQKICNIDLGLDEELDGPKALLEALRRG